MANDIINAMSKQFNQDSSYVSKAWDLAKEQAKGVYPETSEEYYPYVVQLVKQNLTPQKAVPTDKSSLFRDSPDMSSTVNDSPFKEEMSDLDYMDWKYRSNNMKAIVRFLIVDKLYQMEFKAIKAGESSWPYLWDVLKKQGITSVLSISVEQLNADNDGGKISVNKNNLSMENKPQLVKTMLRAIDEYFKKYGVKKEIQYFIFTAESKARYDFLKGFVKSLEKKFSFISEREEVSQSISTPTQKLIACKNINARLSEEDGTVSSDAFSAAPFDAKRKRKDWRKDFLASTLKAKKKKGKRKRVIHLESID